MEKELPKIDLPEEWIVGTGISKELLSLYTNFPCRIKSEIFVLCLGGEVEASVNLNKITVRKNDFVSIMPGTILQIHSVKGELELYLGGFSSKYVEQANLNPSTINTLYIPLGRPLITLRPEGATLLKDYFCFLIKLYEFFNENTRKLITSHLYSDIHTGIAAMYNNRANDNKSSLSKSEILCKNFTQLVMQNYNKTRNVSWYAEKLGITSYTSLYNCETSHGKYMYGNHLTDGHHGCKITIKINKIVYSGNFRLAEFCQYVLFRKIFQTLCRYESAGIQKQRISTKKNRQKDQRTYLPEASSCNLSVCFLQYSAIKPCKPHLFSFSHSS